MANMTTAELRAALKPCPFCGHNAPGIGIYNDLPNKGFDHFYGFVCCENKDGCGVASMEGHTHPTHDECARELIKLWNARNG